LRHGAPGALDRAGFGAGLSPAAAGTVGTLWAWLVWALLLAPLAPAAQGAVIALTLLAGWWAAPSPRATCKAPTPAPSWSMK
jgi:phosphatidylglycerophosphatase A